MSSESKPAPDPNALWLAFLDAANAADWDAADKAIDGLLGLLDSRGPYPKDWDYLKHYGRPGIDTPTLGYDKMAERLTAFSMLFDDLTARKEELADLAALLKRVEGNGWHRLAAQWGKAEGEPLKELPHFAWPGGYPISYWTGDGGLLCPTCANSTECRNADPESDGDWDLEGGDVYWEGPPGQCDNCNKPIESAYGDPDEKEESDATHDS